MSAAVLWGRSVHADRPLKLMAGTRRECEAEARTQWGNWSDLKVLPVGVPYPFSPEAEAAWRKVYREEGTRRLARLMVVAIGGWGTYTAPADMGELADRLASWQRSSAGPAARLGMP